MFDLSFHFVLIFFANLNFFKCVFATMYLLNYIFLLFHLLVVNSFWYVLLSFLHDGYCSRMKEVQLIVAMDDLDFGLKMCLRQKIFNRYGIFLSNSK